MAPAEPQLEPNNSHENLPVEMQQIRIVPAPEKAGVKEDPDPSKVLVVGYDDFTSVVNELSGAQPGNMNRFGAKLAHSVRGEAIGQFAMAIEAARVEATEQAIATAHALRTEELETLRAEVTPALEEQYALGAASREEEIAALKRQVNDAAAAFNVLESEVADLRTANANLAADLADCKKSVKDDKPPKPAK